MKKIFFTIISLLALKTGFGQTMQASIGAGGSANNIKVYLRADATQPAAVISTLQFNVGIPSSVTPVPTLALISNSIAGVTWIIDPPYVENGYLNYNIYNAQAGYNLNVTNGVEFEAMELSFTGGPAGTFANTAHLVTLPDGGVGGTNLGLFYCTGTINSNGQNLYYARDGNVVVANGDSYRYTPPGGTVERGTFTSYARFTPPISLGGTLPVTFTNYDVKCNDKGALLKWGTATEQNTDRFEIQRSTNGTDWITIDNVAAAGISNSQRNYQYLDLNGGTAYYRIRQVDLDGRFIYTAVKATNCKAGQFDVTLFPVPAQSDLNVVIKSDKAVKTDLQILDMSGRIVQRTSTQINKGNNNIKLDVSQLPGGQYMLVSSDASVMINKKFTVIR
ncbi:MAG: T9SS type A sorting domain-containing protein [Chitinophagaceae bacterium]